MRAIELSSWKIQSKGNIKRESLPNRHSWQNTPKAFQQQYGGQLHVSKPFDLSIKYQNASWVTLHGSNLLYLTTQPSPPDAITFDLLWSAANFLTPGIDLRALARWISDHTAVGIQNATFFCRTQKSSIPATIFIELLQALQTFTSILNSHFYYERNFNQKR